MQKYMIQLVSTPQNVAALMKNPEDRTETVRSVLKAGGATLEQYYNSFTEAISFIVANVPDEKSLSAILAAFYAGGGLLSAHATPIMTASESTEIFKKAASISYRPPIMNK
jgi:uncharacterized protein with GYD domain